MGIPIRVAIVEDNIGFCRMLVEELEHSGKFRVVGTAANGDAGLELINSNYIDVVLLDIAVPQKDGLYILEELMKNPERKPVCIVISGINQEHITKKALDAGADYYVIKPFDIGLLIKRAEEMYLLKKSSSQQEYKSQREARENNAETFVANVLHSIPIPNNIKGYEYLKYGILASIKDKEMLESITKSLYPTIASHHKTTSMRVERAIRHAIETAWAKNNGENYYSIIGYGNPSYGKPSNSAFVSAIVELYTMSCKK